jgi:hypothetical protein
MYTAISSSISYHDILQYGVLYNVYFTMLIDACICLVH